MAVPGRGWDQRAILSRVVFVAAPPLGWGGAAVALSRAATVLPSAAFALPYPTKSIICDPVGTAPLNRVELLTRAIFPSVALRLMLSETSGVGSETDPPLPCAS